jgi:hypothetical protein
MNDNTGEGKNFFDKELTSLVPDKITVKLTVPGEEADHKFETEFPGGVIPSADEFKLKRFRHITYFKVKEHDRVKTKFDSEMLLKIKITYLDWEEASKNEYKRPRVFYLAREDNSWATKWVEFIDGISPDENAPGSLTISIEELEDPLIGGT